jgi:hypothetical protein
MAAGDRRWLLLAALAVACGDRSRDPDACVQDEVMLGQDLCNQCYCDRGRWWSHDLACASEIEDVLCYRLGLRDGDPDEPGVQLLCSVLVQTPRDGGGVDERLVPECVLTTDGYTWPTSDVDACWYGRTDTAHTGDPIDDVTTECIELRGDLLAAEIVLLPRAARESASEFTVSCAAPEPQCPGPASDTSG